VTTADVALYILNNKRAFVTNMERRYGVTVMVTASDRMQGANFAIERSSLQTAPQRVAERAVVNMESGFSGQPEEDEVAPRAAAHEEDAEAGQARDWVERDREEEGARRGRGRRRRRGRREERHEHRAEAQHTRTESPAKSAEASEDEGFEPVRVAEASLADRPGNGEQPSIDGADEQDRRGRRRRRGRRGGRRGRERDEAPRAEGAPHGEETGSEPHGEETVAEPHGEETVAEPHGEGMASEPHGNGEGEGRADHAEAGPAVAEPIGAEAAAIAVGGRQDFAPPPEASGNGAPHRAQGRAADHAPGDEQPYLAPRQEESLSEEPAQPARKGWWQRRFSV
jgi:ribonuclease E